MPFLTLGEAKLQRGSLGIGPLAAVAHATRDKDYIEVYRAPSDRHVRVLKVSHYGNATHAAAATNYVDIQACKISGTTVTAAGTTLTTNTGGGWTAQVENNLITDGKHTLILGPGDRLAIQMDNVGTGVATVGMSFHFELEVMS